MAYKMGAKYMALQAYEKAVELGLVLEDLDSKVDMLETNLNQSVANLNSDLSNIIATTESNIEGVVNATEQALTDTIGTVENLVVANVDQKVSTRASQASVNIIDSNVDALISNIEPTIGVDGTETVQLQSLGQIGGNREKVFYVPFKGVCRIDFETQGMGSGDYWRLYVNGANIYSKRVDTQSDFVAYSRIVNTPALIQLATINQTKLRNAKVYWKEKILIPSVIYENNTIN